MLPLTGTTDAAHMQADLAISDFRLSRDDLQTIEAVAMA
jgi:diketogulonate reductase-like aldo/keto reductase